MTGCAESDVTVVLVTYGNRRILLEKVLGDLPKQGVSKAVVVDNGALWEVASLLGAKFGAFVDVVAMGRNTGSAGGYAAGIQRAMDLDASFIWLLDDDNQPADGCLSELLAAYVDEQRTTPRDRLAVLAFRPDHQADVAAGVPQRYLNARRNSFCGFHVLDIPYKIWRRTPWGRPMGLVPDRVRLDVAPYSGLLMRREAVQKIGVPDADFVLYADDTEYSWRITSLGGRIVLVTAAYLRDIEMSWNVKARSSNGFAGWLESDGDMRAYYGMRNQAYFDGRFRCKRERVFATNRAVYGWVLWLYAQLRGKRARYALLKRAIAQGCARRLGVAPEFPL